VEPLQFRDPWRGRRPKPTSLVRLGGDRLGLRVLVAEERMIMPLAAATFRMLYERRPPRADA
jgi:hypothetical protein